MDGEDAIPSVNFISCVKWVRRGVAVGKPTKVELSKQELEKVIKKTRANLRLDDGEVDSGTENDELEEVLPSTSGDEFNMDTYDEDDKAGLNLSQVVYMEKEDGYNPAEEEIDSEEEDDILKASDNLIVVGHVEGDASILEVYVYNEDEGSLYVHHDVLLPSIPLAIEWLNYDPENINVSANLCAVGDMSPIIQLWDLDLINTIVPACKLGKKRNRNKGRMGVGHKDAVLDLSWNKNLTHILASGSADKTVILWDLEIKTPSMTLTTFDEKIQTLLWHPTESHCLLTGSADRMCKLWDCRTENSFKSWTMAGEVEKVFWYYADPNFYVAADNQGNVSYYDIREEAPVWSIKAHDSLINGLHLSPSVPDMLASVCEKGLIKIWDLSNSSPTLIAEKHLKIGGIQCFDFSAESPFTYAAGGEFPSHNFIVQSLMEIESVNTRFGSRKLLAPPAVEGLPDVAGPSVKVKEKRPRSTDRSLNVRKQKKKFKNIK